MRVDLFDFDLPDRSIALRPASPRDSARLLAIDPQRVEFADQVICDLPSLLQPGDALVFNDTRVIPAQLEGFRFRDGGQAQKISVTLHLRVGADCWHAFAKPAKRLKQGDRLVFSSPDGTLTLTGIIGEKCHHGEIVLHFDHSGTVLDQALGLVGHIPLPPYIASKRAEDERDRADYQTIYAREEGAVAAPTAGLHFTPELFKQLDERGIERHFVTLHVGAGTFLPVKTEDTNDHIMHYESGQITGQTAEKLNAVRARGGRIIAVGTTSLRVLESATDEAGIIREWSGTTDIFITPGYEFRAVDWLLTNFHLPKSTLFMLVCAFCGIETMQSAYRHAITSGYRFYSYGDASLLKRNII